VLLVLLDYFLINRLFSKFSLGLSSDLFCINLSELASGMMPIWAFLFQDYTSSIILRCS
jgi:hypothetical protein